MSTRTSALEADIFGVDIQSGDVRGSAPSFALVHIDGETIERDVVSFRKLKRLIDEVAPAIIAIDNVFELAPDKDGLVRLLRALPDTTALVQVTGDEEPEPLSRVANRHDITYDASPMGEAEAAARLAASNVGYEVRAFEETTEVRVTRGRSPGKGGSSEDRFTRRIHGSVRRTGREVTDRLEEAALSFDREVTEKYGGWSNATFTVDATPDALPVSARRSGDVRIEVEPVRSDGIEFEPLVTRREHVIVGVDPGTNVAIGLVDLDGSVLDVWSSRSASSSDVVEWIVNHGRPLLVAADVEPMPSTVDDVRTTFDAVGWSPETDLPVDEKLHRVRDVPVENDHERDAVAAALFAFDDHADALERITRRTPPGMERGRVAALVLGEGVPIETAVERLIDTPEEESPDDTPEEPEPDPQQRRIRDLEAEVARKEDHIESLRETLSRRDERIDELEDRLRRARSEERRAVRRERAVTRLEREKRQVERRLEEAIERADELEAKVERMKALWRLDHSNFADVEEQRSGLVPVKPVEKFTVEAIEAADEAYGLARDDVIFLRDATGAGEAAATRLASIEPRVVLKSGGLTRTASEVLRAASVPVGPIDAVAMQEVDELAVAREDDVEAVLERWRERDRERRLERKRELVDDLIDEHRRGRS